MQDYATSHGKSLAIFFVDLAKAYDRVLREIIFGWFDVPSVSVAERHWLGIAHPFIFVLCLPLIWGRVCCSTVQMLLNGLAAAQLLNCCSTVQLQLNCSAASECHAYHIYLCVRAVQLLSCSTFQLQLNCSIAAQLPNCCSSAELLLNCLSVDCIAKSHTCAR